MERVFLDSNILFSAAYRSSPATRVHTLWRLPDVALILSPYVFEEVRRNLETEEQRTRLNQLLGQMVMIAPSIDPVALPRDIRLPEKDVPILQHAIEARADYLLTGDQTHFGPYYHQTIEGVRISSLRDYLESRDTSGNPE